MASKELERRIDKALVRFITSHPFYSVITMATPIVWTKRVPRAGTDGRNIYFNPDWVETIPDGQLTTVLAHEAEHNAYRHFVRQGGREMEQWNIACDHVINNRLVKVGFEPLKDWVCDPGFSEMSEEEVYQALPPMPPGGQGQGTMQGQNPGNDIMAPKDGNGQPLPKREQQELDAEWKTKLQQAVDAAKRAGKLPAHLERLVKDFLTPTVSWQDILQGAVCENVYRDYSWNHPDETYLQRKLVVPSLYSEGKPLVVFIGDTSGSISELDNRRICSELLGALDFYDEQGQGDMRLPVLWCDTKVVFQEVEHVSDLKPVGGGGTSFAPAWKYIAKHGIECQMAVYATDGHCSEFGEQPLYPVYWIIIPGGVKPFEPPFGQVMYIDEEEE